MRDLQSHNVALSEKSRGVKLQIDFSRSRGVFHAFDTLAQRVVMEAPLQKQHKGQEDHHEVGEVSSPPQELPHDIHQLILRLVNYTTLFKYVIFQ
jgi:hypothetical protein